MAQQKTKELAVITLKSPILAQFASEDALRMINGYLHDSKFTAEELLLDLGGMLTVNPQLNDCTPESMFNCVLFAARHQATFGAYGVYIQPRKIGKTDLLQAIPVLAAKCREAKTKEKLGVARIVCEVVREGEKFEVISDRGVVIGVEHKIDYTQARDAPKGLLLGYGIGVWPDDDKRFYHIVTLADINRAKDASAAQTSGPWTNKNFIKMVHKTIMNRTTEAMVGDFTVGLGGGGSLQLEDDITIDADFENVLEDDIPFGKPGTSSDDVAEAITKGAQDKQEEIKPEEKSQSGLALPKNGEAGKATANQAPSIIPLSEDAQKMAAGAGPHRRLFEGLGQALSYLKKENPNTLARFWVDEGQAIADNASNDRSKQAADNIYNHFMSRAAVKGFPQDLP